MKNITNIIRKALGLYQSFKVPLKPDEEVWTEYMSWISFANAGMLTRGNVTCFEYAISHLPSDAPVIEIGSFCGLSTNIITYLMKKHNVKGKMITCDKWIFEGSEEPFLGDSGIPHKDYRDFVRGSYIRNIRMFSRDRLPYTVEMFSDEFFEAWSKQRETVDVLGQTVQLGGLISFCYIDGNHSYEYVRRDFENCDRYLERRGFILFDDSSGGFEVSKVMPEVLATGRYKLIAQNPNHFFKKIKD